MATVLMEVGRYVHAMLPAMLLCVALGSSACMQTNVASNRPLNFLLFWEHANQPIKILFFEHQPIKLCVYVTSTHQKFFAARSEAKAQVRMLLLLCLLPVLFLLLLLLLLLF